MVRGSKSLADQEWIPLCEALAWLATGRHFPTLSERLRERARLGHEGGLYGEDRCIAQKALRYFDVYTPSNVNIDVSILFPEGRCRGGDHTGIILPSSGGSVSIDTSEIQRRLPDIDIKKGRANNEYEAPPASILAPRNPTIWSVRGVGQVFPHRMRLSPTGRRQLRRIAHTVAMERRAGLPQPEFDSEGFDDACEKLREAAYRGGLRIKGRQHEDVLEAIKPDNQTKPLEEIEFANFRSSECTFPHIIHPDTIYFQKLYVSDVFVDRHGLLAIATGSPLSESVGPKTLPAEKVVSIIRKFADEWRGQDSTSRANCGPSQDEIFIRFKGTYTRETLRSGQRDLVKQDPTYRARRGRPPRTN